MRYKVWFGSGNASFKDFLLKVHNLLNSLIWRWTKLTEFWRKRKTKKSQNSDLYSTFKLKENISSTYLMTIAKLISKNASIITQKFNLTPSSKPKAITKSQFMMLSKSWSKLNPTERAISVLLTTILIWKMKDGI